MIERGKRREREEKENDKEKERRNHDEFLRSLL